MKRFLTAVICLCFAIPSFAQDRRQARLKDSYDVMRAVTGMPDKGIRRDLLNKAECVVVVPSVKKAAFIVGASYGRGVMTCRSGATFRGPWSAPAFFAIGRWQLGLQTAARPPTTFSWLWPKKVAKSLMTSKVKLGGDASVAAGPVGRATSD